MAPKNEIVKEVVGILNDGHKGFMEFAEHIKDPQVKAFFVKESEIRAEYANELQLAAGLKSDEAGTSSGAIHRFWGDVKANLAEEITPCLRPRNRAKTPQKKPIKRLLRIMTSAPSY